MRGISIIVNDTNLLKEVLKLSEEEEIKEDEARLIKIEETKKYCVCYYCKKHIENKNQNSYTLIKEHNYIRLVCLDCSKKIIKLAKKQVISTI